MRTIEQHTGIRIDDYVEIGLGGVVGMVDAVGGIEICPTQDMKDKLANLDIKKGCQEADGTTALGYARSRHTVRASATSTGPSTSARWSPRSATRWSPRGPSSTRSATGTSNMAVPDSFAFGEGTGPLGAAMWASAMTQSTATTA